MQSKLVSCLNCNTIIREDTKALCPGCRLPHNEKFSKEDREMVRKASVSFDWDYPHQVYYHKWIA